MVKLIVIGGNPVANQPFSICSQVKFKCKRQISIPANEKINSFKCVYSVAVPKGALNPAYANKDLYPTGLVVQTSQHIYRVYFDSWKIDTYSPSNPRDVDDVIALEGATFGISRAAGTILHIRKESEEISIAYHFTDCKIIAMDIVATLPMLFSLVKDSMTPAYMIQNLEYDKETDRGFKAVGTITCSQPVISLKYYDKKVAGTSETAIFIWSLASGECLCELALPGSDSLICHVIRSYNSHTFLSVSTGDKLYTLVLGSQFTQQRLLSELQTQGNVFVCGYYAVFSHQGVMFVYSLVNEGQIVKVLIPNAEIVAAAIDSPVFVLRSGQKLQICRFE